MIWAAIWYWLFTIFSIADIITTRIGLAVGLHEANPLMAPFIDSIIEMKLIVLFLAVAIVLVYEQINKGSGWFPLALGTCATAGGVISNIALICGMI